MVLLWTLGLLGVYAFNGFPDGLLEKARDVLNHSG
jgi:hypothetical protein